LNRIKTLALVVSASLLSGCSWLYGEDGLIKDTRYDYVKAKQASDIKVPEPLVQKDKVDYTPIPAIGEKAKQAPVGDAVALSAPIQILAVLDNVRVNKKANNPSVYIIEDSEFLWDAIINLFETHEATIVVKDKSKQIIQTDWMAVDERGVWLGLGGNDDIDEFRAKYRVQLSDGVLRNEKQVEVTRIAAEKLDEDTDAWKPVPSFWQDSAEMLNLVISHYDALAVERDKQSRASLIAGFKVQLAKDEKDAAALVTDASLEHVWEKLPKVLKALDFEVNDRDRRQMTYFVNYENQEPGFFASLFEEEKERLPLETGEYQVTLRELGERTAIVFRDGQGEPLKSDMMVKLYPTLSKLFGVNR